MTSETLTTESTPTTDTVRAWVGCLGCYNNGDLVGEWLTADDCGDLVAAGLARSGVYVSGSSAEFCRRCGADEFWVMDHEGLPAAVLSGECSPWQFHELATAWESVESPEMVAAWLGDCGETVTGKNLTELAERAGKDYTGCETAEEYAEEFVRDCGDLAQVPEYLHQYINYASYAHDMKCNGELYEREGYVFRSE
jgi:antirestriction protein